MNRESSKEFKRSPCPVASLLDIIGDKWTLLVVRDITMGKRIYSEFSTSPEKIPSNILAERLKRLEKEGIIKKQPYQHKPVRYEYLLTEKGEDLKLVMKSMVKWSNKHITGTYTEEQISSFKQQIKTKKPYYLK